MGRVCLDASTINNIYETFINLDEDGSNTIGVDEFETMLDALGCDISEEEVKEVFDEVDVDHSGQITFSELLVFISAVLAED